MPYFQYLFICVPICWILLLMFSQNRRTVMHIMQVETLYDRSILAPLMCFTEALRRIKQF